MRKNICHGMSTQYAIYKEVYPPSGITHCVSAFFTQPSPRRGTSQSQAVPNLIVVRARLLQIFNVRLQTGPGAGAPLVLVAEYPLAGMVESLAALRTRFAGLQRDALLLTFRDAKLVVLDWDPDAHSVRPTSLHYFEKAVPTRGRTAFATGPRAVTDPQGRCAAVTMMDSHLAFLPAMEPEVLEQLLAQQRSQGDPTSPQGIARTLGSTVGNAILMDLHKLGIKRVRAAAFLHRYNEPVLAVLHETHPGWAGRARRGGKDNLGLVAFSVNLSARRYPRLWAVGSLPEAATQLVPVRTGGVLVLAKHLILYHTQAYGGVTPHVLDFAEQYEAASVTASRHADKYATNIHPEAAPAAATGAPRAEGFDLDLAEAAWAWVTDSALLLTLADGALVMLTLHVESGTVKRMKVENVGNAPPPSQMCTLGQDLLFLGSWGGDSLLVQASPDQPQAELVAQIEAKPAQDPKNEQPGKAAEPEKAAEDEEELPTPRKRQRLSGPETAVGDTFDDDDAEVSLLYRVSGSFGAATAGPTAPAAALKLTLQVLDTLHGIGPIRDLALAPLNLPGDPEASPSKESAPPVGSPTLLAAVGQGRSGALAILRHNIVPDVITHVPVQGVQGVWAVRFWPEGLDWEPAFSNHAFLLLGLWAGTKILQAGGGDREDDEDEEESGAGLTEMSAAEVGFDMARPTILAGNLLNDSRILQVCKGGLRLLSGTTVLQEVAIETLAALIPAAGVPGSPGSVFITSAAVSDPFLLLRLSDDRALLLCANPETGELGMVDEAPAALSQPQEASSALLSSFDAASALVPSQPQISAVGLYADMAGSFSQALGHPDIKPEQVAGSYAAVAHMGGGLTMYRLPGMQRMWACGNAADGPALLIPGTLSAGLAEAPGSAQQPPIIREICLECFAAGGQGPAQADLPFLVLLLSDGTLLIYKAFRPRIGAVRFVRQHLNRAVQRHVSPQGAKMYRFDSLLPEGGKAHSGIFVGGVSPLWLIAHRGTLVPHPCEAQGPVVGFTPFNNPSCPHGFILALESGALQICRLPPRTLLTTPWPLQKASFRAPVTALCFHRPTGHCVLTTARQVPWKQQLAEEEGGDPHASYAYAAANAAARRQGTDLGCEVRLIRPGLWTTAWNHTLEPGELATAIASVQLRDHDNTDGLLQALVVVGTSQGWGEDYPCQGRLVPIRIEQTSRGGTGHVLSSRGVAGPVRCMAAIEGNLAVGAGPRVHIFALKSGTLERIAFHDALTAVTALTGIKAFLAYGDAMKGMAFLHASQNARQLTELSKDYDNADVVSLGTLVAGGKLSLLCADRGGTLRIFAYVNQHPKTWRGKRLLPLGQLHVGHVHSCLLSGVKLQPSPGQTGALLGALAGSTDGGLAGVLPLGEDAPVAMLESLGEQMNLLPSPTGLNPKSFRRRHRKIPGELGGGRSFSPPTKDPGLVDGEALWGYMHLSHSGQARIAAAIGVDVQTILQALHVLGNTLQF